MDMIKIVCPLCDSFLAYVRPDTDVYCPKCQKFIYMGLKDKESPEISSEAERQNWSRAAVRKKRRKTFV